MDEDFGPGRFLLTRSAPPLDSYSGAGRIAKVRMRPLTLPERGVSKVSVSLASLFEGDFDVPVTGMSDLRLTDYADLILASGFPGLQHLRGRALQIQLDGYLERIVDRDMSEEGHRVRRPLRVRVW